jgi:peptidyl-prolyl cis-trans isomerase C
MDLTAACGIKPVHSAKTRKVSVNGVEITGATIAKETQNHPAATPMDAWQAAARALAIRELLLQEAKSLLLVSEPMTDNEGRREVHDEALVRTLIEHQIKTPEPDEETCRRYYTQNPRRFRSSDLAEVSHILLAAPPGDNAARFAAKSAADSLIAELTMAPERFADLARLNSACPSRDVGGNLGQIGPGQTVPEFERALITIPAGTICSVPVESRYGFHVVRVNRRENGVQLPFSFVHERIAGYLAERVRRTAIRHYILVLAGRSNTTGIEFAGSNTALVQ